jgi:phosphoenolpyruvate carboxykinase (GTP)
MGDYFQHWLDMGRAIPHPPKIFHVNWFRRGADGKFLWPGYGENVRVLKWILERVNGQGQAEETPIGFVPTKRGLTLDGLNILPENMEQLLHVDAGDWQKEAEEVGTYFNKFGDRLPKQLRDEQTHLAERLSLVTSAKT